NEKPESASAAEPPSTNDAFAEWDDPSTIAAVEQALGPCGSVIRLEADQFFPQELALARPDLVFNMAEGLHGQSREALVPAICEYLNVPYTGSDPLTLALSLHKGRTKEILAFRGVPTAPFASVQTPADLERVALPFPVFVKPIAEGSGRSGLHGQSREALVPAICEYLNVPYTGSDPLTLALSLHKGRTKEILAFRGVPTAPFASVQTPADLERVALPFPVFVKPIAEGSGKGV